MPLNGDASTPSPMPLADALNSSLSPSVSLHSPTSPPLSSGDGNFTYYVAYASLYSLGALYLAPSLISWTRMSRNIYTEDKTAVRLFALLGFGSLLRALAFLLVALWMIFVIKSNGSTHEAKHLHLSYMELVTAWQALSMVASIVLVSVFLLIFNTWASMIEQVDSSSHTSGVAYRNANHSLSAAASSTNTTPPAPPRVLFMRMVLATNAFQIATFFLLTVLPAAATDFCTSLNLFATVLLILCFLVCILLLPAYGQRMCALLGKVAEGASRRQRNIRRIAAISAVFFAMRALSSLLLAFSEYKQQFPSDFDDVDDNQERSDGLPLKRIIEANPIFFFSPPSGGSSAGLLHWVVFAEVVEFPVEWALLMTLLCVLPSRAVLPSIRGYQAIPTETKRRF